MTETQRFGGVWTEQKLNAVEKYLEFYTTALKNQPFRSCYIDAFSGSGSITLKDGKVLDGSVLRALKYPFDFYYFFDTDKKHCTALSEKIEAMYPEKAGIASIINGDCNEFFQEIDKKRWYDDKWRGVVFLDPYAMELSWSCLTKISNTKVFDVWYLFPFSATQRNLPRSGEIQQANEDLLTKIFGSDDWMQHIYQESNQMKLWGSPDIEKIPEGLKDYLLSRLEQTFPTVAPNPVLLRNDKNSPMFLLCFAGSNPDVKAKALSLRGAKHILDHV